MDLATRAEPRRRWAAMATTGAIVLAALGGCSRSGLFGESIDDGFGHAQGENPFGDAAAGTFDGAAPPFVESDAAVPPIVSPDAAPPTPTTTPEPTSPDPTVPAPPATTPTTPVEPAPPGCVPSEETCNGVDDDCNGLVDELPGIPCPGGGARYCVAGRLSECPRRCDVCMPGTTRVCFLSYCTFWAQQTCTADGRGFGVCTEETVPDECRHAIRGNKKTRELEECCLANGYCCMDDFDLDEDGITREMIGQCDEVRCD